MSLVSVVVPCYNEEATIRLLLDAIRCQQFPLSNLEVIISDGMSTDRTRLVVADFQHTHPDLRVTVVDNPTRSIPAALNRALQAAQGEFIVRLDAHSVPNPDYVTRCVSALQEGKGENVGGVWDICPGGTNWAAKSIACAAGHPLGVGDAHYRHARSAGYVDTVPFGAFRRRLLDRVGYFDENLLTNEDYEFNTRVRLSGGRVWLDPKIRSVYFARPNLKALARQYWRYGYWKYQMLRRYPESLRWRQALPPVFILCVFLLAALSPWIWLARAGFLLALGAYGLVLVAASLPPAVRNKDLRLLLGIPAAIAVMHFCWGLGFIVSLISSLVRKPAVR